MTKGKKQRGGGSAVSHIATVTSSVELKSFFCDTNSPIIYAVGVFIWPK